MADAANAKDTKPAENSGPAEKFLFWACFLSLIATAFGFIIRNMLMDTWAEEFNLTNIQRGEIFGVGLWPFGVSIVVFSLVIDRIGYGKAMIFAFFAHITYAIVTICAPFVLAGENASPEEVEAGQQAGYWMLYIGNLIFALGNGTVEAVINPVVATLFPRAKTKWLNILHAGWPGGLVFAGLLVIAMDPGGTIGSMVGGPIAWQWKVGLILIPAITYGVMMLFCKFPVSERVAAGVSYREMLSEFGTLGTLIVSGIIVRELGRVFGFGWPVQLAIVAVLTIATAIYVRGALGRPMFIFLLLIMIPLATTELGVDSWITALMEPVMTKAGWHAGWVLVYTSIIMMVLRLFASGPLVHKLSPLGLLSACSVIAAIGLILLSQVEAGIMILVAATVYGIGKTFFWPTMLGVVAEQFPKGGALTLNATGGMGMIGVGVIGAVFLGAIQDNAIDRQLEAEQPELHEKVMETKQGVFGSYQGVEPKKVNQLPKEKQDIVADAINLAKKNALATVAIFPGIMFVCYMILIFYFRSKGGYDAQVLTGHEAKPGEFDEGQPGPVDR